MFICRSLVGAGSSLTKRPSAAPPAAAAPPPAPGASEMPTTSSERRCPRRWFSGSGRRSPALPSIAMRPFFTTSGRPNFCARASLTCRMVESAATRTTTVSLSVDVLISTCTRPSLAVLASAEVEVCFMVPAFEPKRSPGWNCSCLSTSSDRVLTPGCEWCILTAASTSGKPFASMLKPAARMGSFQSIAKSLATPSRFLKAPQPRPLRSVRAF
mmetsp:Transcript_179611/g.569599  ORF Transcript_179611/g.569599 Transcript_179611/m.569599 type:complete len:214 (+) Transcript_179611:334-975(+)